MYSYYLCKMIIGVLFLSQLIFASHEPLISSRLPKPMIMKSHLSESSYKNFLNKNDFVCENEFIHIIRRWYDLHSSKNQYDRLISSADDEYNSKLLRKERSALYEEIDKQEFLVDDATRKFIFLNPNLNSGKKASILNILECSEYSKQNNGYDINCCCYVFGVCYRKNSLENKIKFENLVVLKALKAIELVENS